MRPRAQFTRDVDQTSHRCITSQRTPRKILMFCDIEVDDIHKAALQQRYCELHNLNVFPAPFAQKPPPPVAPPADQDGLLHIRGGGGKDDARQINFQDSWGLSEEKGSPRTNTIAIFQIDGSPLKDSQAVGAEFPPFTQRDADSPEKQPSQEEQPNNVNAAAATGGLGVGQAATSDNYTLAASGQHCPAITQTGPPPSILRKTDTNVPANLEVRFEGQKRSRTKSCKGTRGAMKERYKTLMKEYRNLRMFYPNCGPPSTKSSSCWMEYTNNFL